MRERDQPIFCVGCGYDVRNLPVDGPCPECSTPIERSLGGMRLAAADPRWLARITLGQSLVAWGLYLALVGFCIGPLTGMLYAILVYALGASFDEVLRWVLAFAVAGVFGVGTVLAWIGAFLVTAPNPGESGTEPA